MTREGKLHKIYLAIIISIASFLLVYASNYFLNLIPEKTSQAANGSVTLNDQSDWNAAGTVNQYTDLTTSVGDVLIDVSLTDIVEGSGEVSSSGNITGDLDDIFDYDTDTGITVSDEDTEITWQLDRAFYISRHSYYSGDQSVNAEFNFCFYPSTEVGIKCTVFGYSDYNYVNPFDGPLNPNDWTHYDLTLTPYSILKIINLGETVDLREWRVIGIPSTATHISAPTQIDGTADISGWATFEPSADFESGTSISFRFRTSADATNWSDWSNPYAYASSIDISALNSAHRYLQVETTLANSDDSSTPSLHSYTVNYTTGNVCDDFDHINISPATSTIESADTENISASPVDASDNFLYGIDIEYSSDCGTVDDEGLFTAPEVSEETVCTVTAVSSCGGSAQSVITISPPAPTCSDGIQDGDETGVDCGGSCDPCPVTPTCFDGIQDGDETGVDCGGSCDPCPSAPTCFDGVQDGDETGVDCGGCCGHCQPICPLYDLSLCDSDKCFNKVDIIQPAGGEVYQTGERINISWVNRSSAVSLIEAWNIRYNIYISYNDDTWHKIAGGIKDRNFANQSAWQKIFFDDNWQSRISANSYSFLLPNDDSIVTDSAKIKIYMYRTLANPFNCSANYQAISNNFSIINNTYFTECPTDKFSFVHPDVVPSSSSSNTYYYYLSRDQISSWPNINLTVSLLDNVTGNTVDNDDFDLSPQDIGFFDQFGRFNISNEYRTPRNFIITYYDSVCNETVSLEIISQSPYGETSDIKVITPNGGEYWLLRNKYAVEWQNTYSTDIIDNISILLSTDEGNSWQYLINKDIKVDSLSEENSYMWKIPPDQSLITEKARIKVVAYDREGKYLDSDYSDQNFTIEDSIAGAISKIIKDNISAISKILLIISALSVIASVAIPIIQNKISIASVYEFFYGLLMAGKKRKNTWGTVYDAFSGTALPYAIITLHDSITKRLIDTTTSDNEGRFGFLVQKGSYFMKIKKRSYEISNVSIIDRQALKYDNNYFGETIDVKDDEQAIFTNIPMCATDTFTNVINQIRIFSIINRILTILNWPLIITGTFVSVIAIVYFPNVINIIIMILYIPIWIFQIKNIKSLKPFGLVLDKDSSIPVDLVLVRLYNKDNKLVRTASSDQKGHYTILANKGEYTLLSQKPGYISLDKISLNIKEGYKPLSNVLYLKNAQ